MIFWKLNAVVGRKFAQVVRLHRLHVYDKNMIIYMSYTTYLFKGRLLEDPNCNGKLFEF